MPTAGRAGRLGASFVVVAINFFAMKARATTGGPGRRVAVDLDAVRRTAAWAWTCGFDQLSMLMMLIVTGVSSVIHVYSIGYMRGDPG